MVQREGGGAEMYVRMRIARRRPLLQKVFGLLKGEPWERYTEYDAVLSNPREGKGSNTDWAKEEVYLW